jgi:hypothetical protein
LETIASRRFETFEEEGVHETDMLLAELDVYEMFAKKYCKGRRRKIALCDSLQVRFPLVTPPFFMSLVR